VLPVKCLIENGEDMVSVYAGAVPEHVPRPQSGNRPLLPSQKYATAMPSRQEDLSAGTGLP